MTSVGYLLQFYKILILKNADGISKYAYIISIVAGITLCIISESNMVRFHYLFLVILSSTVLASVIYFQKKTKYQSKIKNKKTFVLASISSLFGIFGLFQFLESFKSDGKGVAIASYTLWFGSTLIMAYYSINTYATISLVVTTLLFSSIVSVELIKRKTNHNSFFKIIKKKVK